MGSGLYRVFWLPPHWRVPDPRYWPLGPTGAPGPGRYRPHQHPIPTCHNSALKASKTNQLRVGTTIVLGATKAEICPVVALLDYLNRRGCTPGPLFITEGGTPLRRQAFVDNIQRALTAAGLEGSKFKAHSFRIGAATTASEVGVPETTIKILGRWRSMAYQRYIRPPPDKLAQVATMLVSLVSSGSELS